MGNNMRIFLSTHGMMASGMVSSVEILYGIKPDNLVTFDAYVDERSLEKEIESFFDGCRPEELKILLCDIYGGSVCNTMMNYIDRDNTVLIAGVTLSLLLQLLVSDGDIDRQAITELVENTRNYTRVIDSDYLKAITVDDDDFI